MSRVPRNIVETAWLAGAVGCVQALITAILTCIVLATHSSCLGSSTLSGAPDYVLKIMITYYLKDSESCISEADMHDGIMASSQVRVWTIIMLSFSCLWLILSIALIIVTDESDETAMRAFQPVAFCWSASTLAVTVVDISLGILFAIDLHNLNNELNSYVAGDVSAYRLDMIRIAAFTLMTLSFKGYVLLIANVVLAILLVKYGFQIGGILEISEHSMHTQGVLSAYSSNKNDPWRPQTNFDTMMFERNSHVNPLFDGTSNKSWQDTSVPPQRPHSKSYDRSSSWQHARPGESSSVGSRPFSYLDKSAPAPAPSPNVVPPWRRDPWEGGPPLPDPDYSPYSGRKLKPALKNNF